MITPEDLHADNPSFSKTVPLLQIVWDTVSTGALKQCPYKYYLSIIEGWQPKRLSVHLYFGLLIHEAREIYDHALVRGSDHEKALAETVYHLLRKSGKHKDVYECRDCGFTIGHIDKSIKPDVAYKSADKMVEPRYESQDPFLFEVFAETKDLEDADKICPNCNTSNFFPTTKFFPWLSDDKNKNRHNLIRTIIWYLDHYKDSEEKTVILADGSPAVELWFRYELPIQSPGRIYDKGLADPEDEDPDYATIRSESGLSYILSGHLDRLVEFAGQIRFSDLKTTKQSISTDFFAKYSPDNQMSAYTAGGKIVFDQPVTGGIIDAAQVAVNFTAFSRGFIHRTTAQLDEWVEDIQHWIKDAERMALAKNWRMNDTACHHFGGCEFREVCSKDPSSRHIFLQKKFVQRQWNPLKDRSGGG